MSSFDVIHFVPNNNDGHSWFLQFHRKMGPPSAYFRSGSSPANIIKYEGSMGSLKSLQTLGIMLSLSVPESEMEHTPICGNLED